MKASEAGVDIVDTAFINVRINKPTVFKLCRSSSENTERQSALELSKVDELSDYWEGVRKYYFPFDTSPPHGTAEVYLHEMPGIVHQFKGTGRSYGLGIKVARNCPMLFRSK